MSDITLTHLNIIFFLMKRTCCVLSINVVPFFVIAVSQVNRIFAWVMKELFWD